MTSEEKLYPITLTRALTDIHVGGFSQSEESSLGFQNGELVQMPNELFELVTFHKKNFTKNLELYKNKILTKNSDYKEIQKNVFIHTNAIVDASTIFNTEKGIVIIEKNVKVLPFSFLVGPLRLDENATVNPHSNISGSYIGKYSKVGGELINTTIENYSNKGHYGFVGDSYIGSWVNIGGGTSTSNMKNTYGKIKMARVESGEQFLGSIMADHVKTAINTSIYTGKIIGPASHIYGTVTTDVPAFTNYISKDNLVLLPLEIAATTAERMMKRRNIEISDEDKKMLSYAYQATEKEREVAGVKNTKLTF